MHFRGVIELNGKTATGIEVPPGVVDSLAGGRRPAVAVTIRNHRYRSSIASMGGRFLLPISAEVRAAAGVAAGDDVEVEVVLDTEPRTVGVPEDLAVALAAATGAKEAFDALAYSHRLRWVLAVQNAKKPDTRARRIAEAVAAMAERSG